MTALVADAISVRRSGRTLLDGVSLAAGPGDFIAVIGPNGAGKSTLLSVLAGLAAPDAGTVSLDGTPLHRWRPRALARVRAYLPQDPRCDWPIAVERLVALGLIPVLPGFGRLTPVQDAAVARALAAADLLDRRGQPATTLSGGELMRAMLARALVGAPRVLIVDEPVRGLDPRHALHALATLADAAAQGCLVIAALHELTQAVRHATRLLVLHGGRSRADGPPGQVLTPALLHDVFGVVATVTGTTIDIIAPA